MNHLVQLWWFSTKTADRITKIVSSVLLFLWKKVIEHLNFLYNCAVMCRGSETVRGQSEGHKITDGILLVALYTFLVGVNKSNFAIEWNYVWAKLTEKSIADSVSVSHWRWCNYSL